MQPSLVNKENNQSDSKSNINWIDINNTTTPFNKNSCQSQSNLIKSIDASTLSAITLLFLLFIPLHTFASSCNIGEIWPASGSATYPDQAKYGTKHKAISKRITFENDAIFRTKLECEYPFYVMVIKHSGSGTAKAIEGNSRNLGRGRHSFEFTADYRDYPEDELQLLIFAGKDNQSTRYKIHITYITVACK